MDNESIRQYKFGSVFLKILFMLLICSVVPVFIGNILIYRKSVSTITSQAIDANLELLTQTKRALNDIFEQSYQILSQVAQDPAVVRGVIDPDINRSNRNIAVINVLRNIAANNKYVFSIYVYSNYKDVVYSSDGNAYQLEDFHDVGWIKEHHRFYLGTVQMDTRIVSDARGNHFNCISLVKNIPYRSFDKLGAVVINITENQLYKSISNLRTSGISEFTFIINEKGTVLSHVNKSLLYSDLNTEKHIKEILFKEEGHLVRNVNGEKTLFTYTTASFSSWNFSEWTLIHVAPLSYFTADTHRIAKFVLIATIICIVIGLTLSFFVSKGLYHPIEDLIQSITNSINKTKKIIGSDIRNEYDFLEQTYTNVLDRNRSMEDIINSIRPVVKEQFFSNILQGDQIDANQIQDRLEFLRLDMVSGRSIVMVMQIDDYRKFVARHTVVKRNIFKLRLTSMIEEIVNEKFSGVCVQMGPDKVSTIIRVPGKTKSIKPILQIASIIKEQINIRFPFTVTLGIGRLYNKFVNVNISYKEALSALNFKIYEGKNKVIDIDSVEMWQDDHLYWYSPENEKVLINHLRTGQYEQARDLIYSIMEDILAHKTLPSSYVQQISIRIVNLIAKILIDLEVTVEDVFGKKRDLYAELSYNETIKDITTWLLIVCETVTTYVNHTKKTRNVKTTEAVVDYIEKNLHTDISLLDAAEYVGLSQAYLSKVFKEVSGRNFLDYLNGCRIDRAKQLLNTTRLSIKEIGFRVGFNTMQNFFRTFKRYEEITPGQFREKA